MNTDLSTGVFSGLGQMFNELIKMTPQQISASGAPDFLKIAAMERQAQARQQPAIAPTSTVAAQVVNQAVGAPPASQPAPQMPQGVPGMDTPPQGAQAGGYIHDYGVASLPYTPNYEHGGIVSFAEGDLITPAFESVKDFVVENPLEMTGLAASFTPWGRAFSGVKNVAKSAGGLKNIGKWGLRGALVASPFLRGEDEQPTTSTELPPAPPEKEEKTATPQGIMQVAAPSAGRIKFDPIPDNVFDNFKRKPPNEVTPETEKARQDAVNKAYELDPKFHQKLMDEADAKATKAKADFKSDFLGTNLMELGAAIAAGNSPNMLTNIAKAFPQYADAINAGRNRMEDKIEKYEGMKQSANLAEYAQKTNQAQAAGEHIRDYQKQVFDLANQDMDDKRQLMLYGIQRADNATMKEFEVNSDIATKFILGNMGLAEAQIRYNAAVEKETRDNLTKGAMSDDKFAQEFRNSESDPYILELAKKYGVSSIAEARTKLPPDKMQFIDNAIQNITIKRIGDSGGMATLIQHNLADRYNGLTPKTLQATQVP